MKALRFKQFLRERNQFSRTGEETLLSVSEYYGVKPRREAFQHEEHESRAASLEGYRIVQKDDLVMNYMLAWKGAYGVSDHDGIVSPAYSVFEVDHRVADVRYLHHRVRSDDMKAYFRSRSKGIIESRLRLYPDSLLASYVKLPDLDTQRQIADFLDRETARIDLLIEKKQRLVALLKDKIESEISHSLGIRNSSETVAQSGFWPSSLPEGWTLPKLSHFAAVGNGSTPSRENSAFWGNEGLPWLNSGAIHQRDVKSSPFHVTRLALDSCHLPIVKPGDLLIAITGQGKTRGTAAICRMTATVSQHIAYVRLQKTSGMLPEFVLLSLRASYRYLRDQSAGIGSTRAALTCDYLKSFHVPKPPMKTQLSLVKKVAETERACSSVSAKTQSSIEKLQEYRSALITAAVTGQIDVASHTRSGTTERTLDALQEEMDA